MTTEVDEHSKVAIIGKSDLARTEILGSSKGALASGVFGSNSYHPPIRRDEVGILAPPKDDPRHEVGLLAPPKGYPVQGCSACIPATAAVRESGATAARDMAFTDQARLLIIRAYWGFTSLERGKQ